MGHSEDEKKTYQNKFILFVKREQKDLGYLLSSLKKEFCRQAVPKLTWIEIHRNTKRARLKFRSGGPQVMPLLPAVEWLLFSHCAMKREELIGMQSYRLFAERPFCISGSGQLFIPPRAACENAPPPPTTHNGGERQPKSMKSAV